jgi:hypothetical protein
MLINRKSRYVLESARKCTPAVGEIQSAGIVQSLDFYRRWIPVLGADESPPGPAAGPAEVAEGSTIVKPGVTHVDEAFQRRSRVLDFLGSFEDFYDRAGVIRLALSRDIVRR